MSIRWKSCSFLRLCGSSTLGKTPLLKRYNAGERSYPHDNRLHRSISQFYSEAGKSGRIHRPDMKLSALFTCISSSTPRRGAS
jgi:hypothetical protein